MLELPNVTVVMVETQAHELARLAALDIIGKANFGGILIHTDKPELISVPGAQYFTVPNWPTKFGAEGYYYCEAHQPAKTSHVLMLQWDAGIRDPAMWSDDFLQWDYIGAPWNLAPKEGLRTYTVGNGGFALISKKMCDHVYANRARFKIVTDYGIARDNREAIENEIGAKWAPEDVAWRFAFENPHGTSRADSASSFGYHDIFNWPLALDREDTIRRTRLVMANSYILGTTKLRQLGNEWGWIIDAIGRNEFNRGIQPPQRFRAGTPSHLVARAAQERLLQAKGLKA